MNLNGAGIVNYYCLVQGNGTEGATSNSNGLVIQGYHRINIPHYQRPYRWGDGSNITELFDDFYDNKKTNGDGSADYFVGASVAVENKESSDCTFEIIDGQQRLTTVYLMNYLLYILSREKVDHMMRSFISPENWKEEVKNLQRIYQERIGIKNTNKFTEVIDEIGQALNKQLKGEITSEEMKNKSLNSFRDALGCVKTHFDTKDKFLDEYKRLSLIFLNNEELTLHYARESYNKSLREILSSVYVSVCENPDSMVVEFAETVDNTSYKKTYYNAFENIFKSIEQAVGICKDVWAKLDGMIASLNEVIEKLNVCMITTPNEDDANRLFEVLNDRALEVADLELVKNHFYMVYCSKNASEDSTTVDQNISTLDDIWSGKVFSSNEVKKNRLIAYLSTVYLTQDKDLDNKNEDKFKKSLKEHYTDQLSEYPFSAAIHDFNVFLSMKKLVEGFDVKFQKVEREAIRAEADRNKTIVYKTYLLLHALNRPGVMAALSNIILAVYEINHSNLNVDEFADFIQKLKFEGESDPAINLINQRAFEIWRCNLLADNYKLPREKIAEPFIENYGHKVKNMFFSPYTFDLQKSLVAEYNTWIGKWRYGSKNLEVTILLLDLFQRQKQGNMLTALAYSYNLQANYINLDHLEPQNIIESNRSAYFKNDPNDAIVRKNTLDSLGNMMILDRDPNIKKSDDPLAAGLKYYNGYSGHWMLQEISEMITDSTFFDSNVPTEAFFEERAKRLMKYFQAVLCSSFKATQIDIT